MDGFHGAWYNYYMREIVKMMVGFVAILIVGLAGVTISQAMKLGEMNALILTVDNIAHAR